MTNIGIRVYSFITSMVNRVKEETGQDTLEWALLGGLIALALVVGFVLFNGAVTNMVKGIGNCIDFTSSTVCNPGP